MGSRLSWLLSWRVLGLDVAKNLVLLLLRPVRRSRDRVKADYDSGVWKRTLADQRWLRCATCAEYLVPADPARSRIALIDGKLTRITEGDYYRFRAASICTLLAGASDGADRLVEVGSGAGMNLLTLANDPRWRRLSGLDISDSGIAAARAAAERFGFTHLDFSSIDLTARVHSGFAALGGQVVFSYYCMEQLKHEMSRVIDNIIAAGPRRVIHIEPTAELWRPWCIRELASSLYTRRQDYQDNLLTTLRHAEAAGRLRILEVRRLHYAPTPRYDPTLIVWEPLAVPAVVATPDG